ncbi:hypothetical protein [Flavobacterium kingsejongi]|uniref:Beta-lactamase-inhibitor-like PepSY-like domain-containing protein n=1 Tax=Flavobacterium kingsejongi TaxID=1678728 RepID=A0A2S1LQ53_9FLAO|nr:hypothetical protein [Flavobacterium kingsejongi]AWG25776.1 hypothetical protein FK004_11360 [Flavobacterium kingsejongi]
MRKLVLLSALVLAFSTTIVAAQTTMKKEKRQERKELRKLEGNEVNARSQDQFAMDFPKNTNPTWERTKNFDEATFMKDGKSVTAYYDYDAILVGTSTVKAFSDLPKKAQKAIGDKYKGYTQKAVIFYDNNEDSNSEMVLYNLPFEDADNYFVELQKDAKNVVVKVTTNGQVTYFADIK